MKPGIKKIIEDAKAAGFETIEYTNSSSVLITKAHKRTGSILKGVMIRGDGTATRVDILTEIRIVIRTQKDIRKLLGL